MILISALLATVLAMAPLLCGIDSAWAAAAPGSNEKLAALKKAAQAEGMLNLVWGENTFRGLQGVRDLVSGMNKQFGTSIIAATSSTPWRFYPTPCVPSFSPSAAGCFRSLSFVISCRSTAR